MDGEAFFDGRVRRIPTDSFADGRGLLSPIDLAACGFRPVRAFVVDAAPGAVRGGHGHRTGRQLLMLVSGVIEVELRWRGETTRLRLDPERRALLIEPPVWSCQAFCGTAPAMVVFCDTPYDPADYIWEADAAVTP